MTRNAYDSDPFGGSTPAKEPIDNTFIRNFDHPVSSQKFDDNPFDTAPSSTWHDGATQVYRARSAGRGSRKAADPAFHPAPPMDGSDAQSEREQVDAFFRDLHMPEDSRPTMDETPVRPEPVRSPRPEYVRPEPPAPAVNAYNRDYGSSPRAARPRKTDSQSSRLPDYDPEPPRKAGKPRRRRKWPWVLLILFLLFVVTPVCLWFFFPSRPDNTANKSGDVATFLLCGTDEGGYRTDTMMLLYVNRDTDAINLLSLPRDSRVVVDGETMKLNAVYAYGGCGEQGMELLMDELEDVIGYRPDTYLLFDFDSLADMIDTMGGITFNVPMDMYYEDSSQDLYIDLKAGTQTLSGAEAVQVLRYRAGYTRADLERIEVQRQMVSAALDQWLSVSKIPSGLSAISTLSSESLSNISTRNFFWLAQSALDVDLSAMESQTLPGEWQNPYYELYYRDRAAMINQYFNPTDYTFTGEDFPE